jgi:hypothetical protein
MEFLACVKLYANKPSNALVNAGQKHPETVNWNERLQMVRRSIIDQLSRLKIEEMCLRNLALKNDSNKRPLTLTQPLSSTTDDFDDASMNHRKRFCTIPSNTFDLEIINQTELDLDC